MKKIKISEVNQIGKIVFKKSEELIIHYEVLRKKCNKVHYYYISYYYDFGMKDKFISHTGSNVAIKKNLIQKINYDLAHAFHHIKFDSNYSHTHWALYGNLKNRVMLFD
jgi:hypothetical protein